MKTKKTQSKQQKPKERSEDALSFRSVTIESVRAEGEDKTTVRMSVSSEEPVLTYGYFNDEHQRFYEILDHGEGSVDMSRAKEGLVIQDRHNGDQIGLMAMPTITDRKLGGDIEFCSGSRAQEIEQDAANGLRRNVSVGYRVDADSYRLEGEKDGIPVVRAMSWMPYEASFEPVPADTSVGVGRSVNIITKTQEREGTKTMSEEIKQRNLTADETCEIFRMARAFNMEPGIAEEHIRADKPFAEFSALALRKAEADKVESERTAKEKKAPVTLDPFKAVGEASREMQDEINKRYNLGNVVRAMAGEKGVDITFEREVSDELAKKSRKSAQGILVPHDIPLATRADPFLKTSNGSNMVATDLLSGQFIDALRSRMVLANAGVTTLAGLVGDVAIPKGSSITGGWIDGENAAGTEGKPTITQVTGTPHTASGWTDISRRLLQQSSIDAQMFVQNELLNTLARLLEVAAFSGTNANGQPKGLENWSNINNPTISVPGTATWAEIVSFMSDIEADNAALGEMSWITRPAVVANLGSLPKVPTYSADMILNLESKSLVGMPYQMTTNVATKSLWLGVWSQLVIGLWSGVDIVVDPYSNSTTGAVRVVALQDSDIMVRNAQSFAYNTAVLA